MPAGGVYVVDVEVQRQRWHRAMASVGKNVTFGEEHVLKPIFLILIKIFMGNKSYSLFCLTVFRGGD